MCAQLEAQSSIKGSLAIQDVIKQVVAPVLEHTSSVLWVVLDGMSWAVLRTLLHDPLLKLWQSAVFARQGQHVPMFCALPSVTTLSRASLLTGGLAAGGQDRERDGFDKNAWLRKSLPRQTTHTLFHKKDLDAQGVAQVGQDVQDAIKDPSVALVALVLNTIDDQLGGAQQLDMQWSVDAIPALRSLLTLAQQSQRTVILASDHGHVVEDSSRVVAATATSARWRSVTNDQTLDPSEIHVRAASVKCYTGEPAAVLLHDERARYTGRKRGYHGGVALPEVVTPLVVLSPLIAQHPGLPPERFAQLLHAPPPWWFLEHPTAPVHVPEHLVEASEADLTPLAPVPQLDLLSVASEPSEVSEVSDVPDDIQWVERLLHSPLYKQQRERFGSLPIAPDDVYRVLVTLNRHGLTAHVNQLARELERADNRVRRLITAMSRVLNLDGYDVLSLDRKEHMVRLDRALLFKQFNLESP